MRRLVIYFLTAFSFSLGLAAGSVAMRPIDEQGSDGPAASDQIAGSDAAAESDAEVPENATDPESPRGVHSTEPTGGEIASRDDLADADPAQIFGSRGDVLLFEGAEDDASSAVQRLARVFARMNPRAAAPILSNLSDTEIQLIMKDVPDRTVAEILSSLEPERAARLTRLLIRAGEVGNE